MQGTISVGGYNKFMKLAGKQFYRMLVVIWLTFSIGSVVLAAASWWNLTRLMAQGRKLSAIRDDMDAIFKSLLDAETATRGYVITGNTNYLQPYMAATNNMPTQFVQLVELVGSDSTFARLVTDLRGQADLSLNCQQQVISARSRSLSTATTLFDTGQGKQVMDGIRISFLSARLWSRTTFRAKSVTSCWPVFCKANWLRRISFRSDQIAPETNCCDVKAGSVAAVVLVEVALA